MAFAAPKHRAAVDGYLPNHARPTDHKLGLAFMESVARSRPTFSPSAVGILPPSGGRDRLGRPCSADFKPPQLDACHHISTSLAEKLQRAEPDRARVLQFPSSRVLDISRASRSTPRRDKDARR